MTLSTSIPKLLSFGFCEECRNKLVESSGHYVCSNCGLTYDRVIAQPFQILNENGQKNTITFSSGSLNNLSNRLKQLNHVNAFEVFYRSLPDLQGICDQLNFPEQSKIRALYLFKYFCENVEKYKEKFGLKLGFNSHYSVSFLFISIYQTTKEHKLLISLSDLFEALELYHKTLSRTNLKKILCSLNLSNRSNLFDYLSKYETELLTSFPEIKSRHEQLLELAKLRRHFQGYTPNNFIASCLYLLYFHRKTLSKKGVVSKISEITGTWSQSFRVLSRKMLIFLKKEDN